MTFCPVCEQDIAVDDGVFRKHPGTGELSSISCPNTGAIADPDNPPQPNPVGPAVEPTGPPPEGEEPPPRE
jgi:hypothetical protein